MRSVHRTSEFQRLAASSTMTGGLLAATGLIVWTAFSVWGGWGGEDSGFHLREAWDTEAYFYMGLPLMALAVAIASFHMPSRIWRWPLWLVAGHQLGVLVVGLGMQSGLSLLILTVMLAILLAVCFAVPAFFGAMMARRLTVTRVY